MAFIDFSMDLMYIFDPRLKIRKVYHASMLSNNALLTG
jgi:hypothetical protein